MGNQKSIIIKILKENETAPSDEKLNELFKNYDKNNDKSLNINESKKLISGFLFFFKNILKMLFIH
jgi:Ca2+-binding EF-hand superfamily protein